MAKQKLYAGTKLRELRRKVDLTQREFSERLEVSLPYLNQMENNNRPVSAAVILALADVFGFDVTELVSGDNARLVSDMREAATDPIFGADAPHLADIRMAANNAPGLARAFLQLHRAYRETHERLASLDEALGRADSRLQSSPWEEVRDFFHYCDNYIDAVDRAAERFAADAKGSIQAHAIARLEAHGVTLRRSGGPALRSYEPESKISNPFRPSARGHRYLSTPDPTCPVDTKRSAGCHFGLCQISFTRRPRHREIGLGQLLCRGQPHALWQPFCLPHRICDMTWSNWPGSLAPASNRSPIASPPCNAAGKRDCPSFLSVSIRPARLPSAIQPPLCNSHALAVHVRFGMCIARLRPRDSFYGKWPRRPTGNAISAWRGM